MGRTEVLDEIRHRWPQAEVWIRGDSGFAREAIMAWCEENGVDYVLGLAKNSRLIAEIEPQLEQVAHQYEQTQEPRRTFTEFAYRTPKSWSRSRRVIAKAEHLAKGRNPRFVVTSLSAESFSARPLYEQIQRDPPVVLILPRCFSASAAPTATASKRLRGVTLPPKTSPV